MKKLFYRLVAAYGMLSVVTDVYNWNAPSSFNPSDKLRMFILVLALFLGMHIQEEYLRDKQAKKADSPGE